MVIFLFKLLIEIDAISFNLFQLNIYLHKAQLQVMF